MKKTLKISLIVILLGIIILFTTALIVLVVIKQKVADVEFDKNKIIATYQSVKIYDSDKELISNEDNFIPLSQLQDYTKNAFISIEDKDFYNHKGLNYKRIAKAFVDNVIERGYNQGASTISQQLIKNTHLNNDKTISRKVKEMFLTKKLESMYTKDEILETYLNVIYFGNGAYGINSASLNYYDKTADKLSISESAVLAGLIKSPRNYSPIYNLDNCIKRRNTVLQQMYNDSHITSEEYEKALSEPIELHMELVKDNCNDLYMRKTLNEAEEILKISSQELAGYKIYTYLDSKLQKTLYDNIVGIVNTKECAVFDGTPPDSVAVAIDNTNYGVSAYAGVSIYDLTKFYRQPGSAIKPILVYAPALEKGIIYPSSMINDEKIDIDGYSPQNVGNVYHGYINVRDSVAYSLNVPAVKIMQQVGIAECKEFAKNCGVQFDENDTGYAIALGGFTKGMTIEDLANTFIPFANGGQYKKCGLIKQIISPTGLVVYQDNNNLVKVMHEDTAYLMTDLLKDGVQYGTSKKLRGLPYEIAGKTGTVALPNTNYNTDAISVAYTTKHTIASWIGNYSLAKEKKLKSNNNGGTFATQIIRNTFDSIYKNNKPSEFTKPSSVIEMDIDAVTLNDKHEIMIANSSLPERYKIKEIFSERNKPTQISTNYIDENYTKLNATINNNKLCISFNPVSHLEYKINVHENGTLFASEYYKNYSEMITKEYSNLKYNSKYIVNMQIYDNEHNLLYTSDNIALKTKESIYDNIISTENKNNWLYY